MKHNPFYNKEIQEVPQEDFNANDLYDLGQLTKEERLSEYKRIVACSGSPEKRRKSVLQPAVTERKSQRKKMLNKLEKVDEY